MTPKLDKLIEHLKEKLEKTHKLYPIEVYVNDAETIITALDRLKQVDAGSHVIVPVEPTMEMIEAGRPRPPQWDKTDVSKRLRLTCDEMRRNDWKGMIEAAMIRSKP